MRKRLRTCRLAFVGLALLLMLFSSCSAALPDSHDLPAIADYRDIPAVTQEERDAIALVKEQRDTFVYGVTESSEAFRSVDTGELSGFAPIFAGELSALFGIDIELRILDAAQLAAGLDADKIDFVLEFPSAARRGAAYSLSLPVADRVMMIFTSKTNGAIEEIRKVRRPRYAFLAGSDMYSHVSAAEGDSFDVFFAQSGAELLSMLEEGTVDAFFEENIMQDAFEYSDIVTGIDYYPLYYRPVSLVTAQPALEAFISVLNKYIQAGYGARISEYYREGDVQFRKHRVLSMLDGDEKAYLQEHFQSGRAIPIIFEIENYPNCFWNSYEKEFQGIAVDVLAQISELTGLSFENINIKNEIFAQNINDLEEGDAALITDLSISSAREGRFLWAAEPYSTDYYVMVSLDSAPDATIFQIMRSRIASKQNTAILDIYAEWFPDAGNMSIYPQYIDALNALDRGEVDFVMMSRSTLLSMTNYLEKPGYKANIVFDFPHTLQFGFNVNENTLRSIISKAQSATNAERIADSWTRKTFNRTRTQAKYIGYFSVLLAIVFVLVLILLISKLRMNKKLEKTVELRTQALAEQTELALVASHAKSDFLSNMSHEIRTPLNAVIGMTEITRRSARDPKKVLFGTGEIAAASTHLLSLINDILDMSKIEAGKFEINAEPFRLLPILDEVYSLMHQRCADKNINFSVAFTDFEDVFVIGDRLRLKQVLINLIGNAVKFTPGGGTVCFAAEEALRQEEAITVHFSVTDTGIGMSEAQVAKLFTPFDQADKTTATKFGGTGLGLAISQNLVAQMGGRIEVSSRPGEGSTFAFTLTLPLTDDAGDPDLGDIPVPELQGKRILVAEDVEINRTILRELLSETHVAIEEAADGQDALDMVAKSDEFYYDLIFMDVQMPRMNGYEASAAIRALDRSDVKQMPIIAVTANAYREDVECAIKAGMNTHIAKPINVNAVIGLLAEKLGRG